METHRVTNFSFYLLQGSFRKHTTAASEEAKPGEGPRESSLSQHYDQCACSTQSQGREGHRAELGHCSKGAEQGGELSAQTAAGKVSTMLASSHKALLLP